MSIPCCPGPLVNGNTEGGRIARVLQGAQSQMAAQALAKARAYRGGGRCGDRFCPPEQLAVQPPPVPPESTRLQTVVSICYPTAPGPVTCPPESVRIAAIQQCVLDNATDPLNRETRFSEFRPGVFTEVCAPIPQEALNANVPKVLFGACPLPNRPDNPVLPA